MIRAEGFCKHRTNAPLPGRELIRSPERQALLVGFVLERRQVFDRGPRLHDDMLVPWLLSAYLLFASLMAVPTNTPGGL